MKINSMTITGLFGRQETLHVEFNSDINVLTGRNGSGKTTIMKLAWFIMSGNILLALKEVDFKSCTLETSEYTCTVIRTGSIYCKVEMEIGDNKFTLEDDSNEFEDEHFTESAEDKAAEYVVNAGSSIFFPTFRRIEGGFSMGSKSALRVRTSGRADSDIDESLAALSRRLSKEEHVFVAAISTQDIVSLLLKRYAGFSEDINSFQAEVSKIVIDKIKHYEREQSSREDADALLSETRKDIEKIEEFRTSTMLPLDAIRLLVERLFQHSGISFGKRLSFGDAAEAVNSEALSAGEKQMLSFICYNAFYKNSIIFIDEPELSLHVDWQRQLYSILQSQNSGNQFIFATHSPFIYGKYPDKEVVIGLDRGD
ncbi:AAA family ATPase [Pseudoxanthomonas sp. UC19_8]|uniref:AAA family ATPase n=1 Tax=Pseudoxanthomonas sp. UC19_8 TaxID=3350175 RepID=UPI0036D2E7C2